MHYNYCQDQDKTRLMQLHVVDTCTCTTRVTCENLDLLGTEIDEFIAALFTEQDFHQQMDLDGIYCSVLTSVALHLFPTLQLMVPQTAGVTQNIKCTRKTSSHSQLVNCVRVTVRMLANTNRRVRSDLKSISIQIPHNKSFTLNRECAAEGHKNETLFLSATREIFPSVIASSTISFHRRREINAYHTFTWLKYLDECENNSTRLSTRVRQSSRYKKPCSCFDIQNSRNLWTRVQYNYNLESISIPPLRKYTSQPRSRCIYSIFVGVNLMHVSIN